MLNRFPRNLDLVLSFEYFLVVRHNTQGNIHVKFNLLDYYNWENIKVAADCLSQAADEDVLTLCADFSFFILKITG